MAKGDAHGVRRTSPRSSHVALHQIAPHASLVALPGSRPLLFVRPLPVQLCPCRTLTSPSAATVSTNACIVPIRMERASHDSHELVAEDQRIVPHRNRRLPRAQKSRRRISLNRAGNVRLSRERNRVAFDQRLKPDAPELAHEKRARSCTAWRAGQPALHGIRRERGKVREETSLVERRHRRRRVRTRQ